MTGRGVGRLPLVPIVALSVACSLPACGGSQSADAPAEPVPTTATPEPPVPAPAEEPAPTAEAPPTAAPEPALPEDRIPDFAAVPLAPGPEGRAIAALRPARCLQTLRDLGIPHERSADARARDVVAAPVVPTGPVGGVTITFVGRRRTNRVMDCRLLVALHAWAPVLRAAGITGIRHLSALRPGARVRRTGQPSGHARGLGVDTRYFEREGLPELDVLEDWQPRDRGAAPCGDDGEAQAPTAGALRAGGILRGVVCEAVRRELFQVVVTPHHDDAHANHVHVEVVPGVAWNWVR